MLNTSTHRPNAVFERLLGLDAKYHECGSHSGLAGRDGCNAIFQEAWGEDRSLHWEEVPYEDLPPHMQAYVDRKRARA